MERVFLADEGGCDSPADGRTRMDCFLSANSGNADIRISDNPDRSEQIRRIVAIFRPACFVSREQSTRKATAVNTGDWFTV